jgi:hypothetical protein
MISKDDRFLSDLATELRRVGLEAIVVGNTASILNDAPVLTQDVDLLIRDTQRNRRKLNLLVAALGGTLIPIADKTRRILGTRVPIDILFDKISGAGGSFAAVLSRSHQEVVGNDILTVASLADIIKSKRAAGRPKDLAVLPILETTLKIRRAKGLP